VIAGREREEYISVMATKIRLARHGAKKHPYYRIIVTDTRRPRDGRRLDQVGVYDPTQKPSRAEFQQEKLAQWLRAGARPSVTVAQLMKRGGITVEAVVQSEVAGVPASDPGETQT
jgi:small subunit ribosomal protein S16